MVEQLTKEIMDLVKDENFRRIVAETVKEQGLSAKEWNSDRKLRLALYLHFAKETILN